MINFTHEIPCPDDRAMRKFFWHSPFHDARILSLQYDGADRSSIILRIDGGGYDVRRGVYHLRFHGVQHFCHVAEHPATDRIYATYFLDSAALRREQAESVKPLYHLRIETWSGYIDVIFARFCIRLEGGRVDYRPRDIDDSVVAANRERRIRQTHAEAQSSLASDHPWDMDVDRYHALGLDEDDLDEYHASGLWIAAQEKAPAEIAAHARKVLLLPLHKFQARTWAAYLLGLHGSAEDLPALTQLLLALPPWFLLDKRVVLDAMERIHERAKEAAHD